MAVSVRGRSPSYQGHQQAQGSEWLTSARLSLGSFAVDDSQGQELVQCALVLDGCARGRSDAGTGGRCNTFVLLLLLPILWLFLLVQVGDGLFVDGVATRSWCISGLVCVANEELVVDRASLALVSPAARNLHLIPNRHVSTPTSGGRFCSDTSSVSFSAHTTLLQVHEREVGCGLDVLASHDALGQALAGSICQH